MTESNVASLVLAASIVVAFGGVVWCRFNRSRPRHRVRRSLPVAPGADHAAVRSAATEAVGAVRTSAATVARSPWERTRVAEQGSVAPAGLEAGAEVPAVPGNGSGPATLPARSAPWTAGSLAGPIRRGDAGVRGGTVIVMGAGGPTGVAVIRELKRHGVRVIGVDAEELAAGLRLADGSVVVPTAGDPRDVAELVALARRTHATALVCTVAEEMAVLAQAEPQLREAGMATWIPSPEALEACLDRWRFVEVMHEAGIRVPATSLARVDRVPGPWIVRPRLGRGSLDVYPADDSRDLAWALRRVDQALVQTRITGRQFTVDALVDPQGLMVGAVPWWRLETRSGISTRGRTFSDEVLLGQTGQVLAAVGLTGAANVQGFVDEAGAITFTEVNPHFSEGLPLSLAAGADLVGQYLRGVLGMALHPEQLTYRSGVTMIRHFEEDFES